MKISDVLTDIQEYKYNPAKLQTKTLDILEQVTNGTIDIVDATNPFIFQLESGVVNTALFIQHTENINRRQYPINAITAEDLYLHMSDKDYIGRFALPSKCKLTIILNLNELDNALVEDSSTGIKKLTIPRNSVFNVGGMDFSLQYPINIFRLNHGGLQIVYDNSIISPLYELSTNIIDWEEQINTLNNSKYIKFSFDVHQFNIISQYLNVNSLVGYNLDVPYSDEFYYARVYMQVNGIWKELNTTHTDQVFDINVPTVLLRLINNVLSVNIPSIYVANNKISGKLRVDIYQTKGNLNASLSSYTIGDFSANWLSIDETENTVYTAAINDIKELIIYSDDFTKGGRSALQLEDLRDRVINNSTGIQNIPITNIQLENSITDAGYEFVRSVDTITNRIYLATKSAISPNDGKLITPAATTMSRVILNNVNALNFYGTKVINNRIVITSDAIYKNNNGVITLLTNSEYNELNILANANKVENINSNIYLYSPFNYILDNNTEVFHSRPYYLENPIIESKSFVDQNTLTGLQVNISNYNIIKDNSGYKLYIKVISNDAYKEIDDNNLFCQLCFRTNNQIIYSYSLGELLPLGDNETERTFKFNLTSNFDVNEEHELCQTNFRLNDSDSDTYCELLQEFQVLFITNANTSNTLINSNSILGKFQVPENSYVITHEKIKVNFGYYLDSLWARCKSIASEIKYQTYLQDVYATYQTDIYDIDPDTNSKFKIENGEIVYNIIHHKDDIMKDSNNQSIIKFRKGDVVFDNSGNPIVSNTNAINRHIDILTIDGVYKFATDISSINYRKLLAESIVDSVVDDLSNFNLSLLEQTKIYYYPKINHGFISCDVGNNNIVNLPANVKFVLNLSVPNKVYNDDVLLAELRKVSIQTINSQLNSDIISISDIEYALKNKYGLDVTDVMMEAMEGLHNVVRILNSTDRFSIKKKLTLLPSNEIIVEEDLEINFTVI